LIKYYNTLTAKPKTNRQEAINKFTQNIPKLVTEELKYVIFTEISLEEVKQVVLEIPKGKSLGLDGFTTDFFHARWLTIKQDIMDVVEDSRSFLNVLPTLNYTFLDLNPK